MPLATGSRLGPYEITAAIGAGGMGEVYRARDPKLGRDVAIKVLPEAFAGDETRMARFQREAKALASLSHPNIATIYGLDDSGTTRALVMELVEGATLADRIRQGPIPVDEAVRIARQIADALEYAHERGIVHRDLKPANVKVTTDDTVKVLDFGLAKALESDIASIDISTSPTISRMATMQGVLLGTAAYMSPEQAKAKPVDRRADIWAFGCVLYEMLTGKQAFAGETVTDTLASLIKEEPDWKALPAAIPMRVRVLLQRCLQKDPKQRLQAIGDARISLDEVLSGAPESTSVGTISAPTWHRAVPWAIAGASLAIALFTLAWAYLRIANNSGPGESVRFQISVPEKSPLSASGVFALSPDGRQLAFLAADPEGVQRIWVRALDSLEARLLLDSQSPSVPPIFWSFDSRYIVFDAGGKLKKIDVAGGPAQTLCDTTGQVVGGSWNHDGVIVFGEVPGAIMRVSASGGAASPVTTLDPSNGDVFHDFPSFLPDGRHFIYRRTSNKAGRSGVYIGSLDVKPEEQDSKQLLATDFAAAYLPLLGSSQGQLLFVRDGTLVTQPFDAHKLELTGDPISLAERVGSWRSYAFFSASASALVYRTGGAGVRQLTWLDREGRTLSAVNEEGSFYTLDLAPDGSRAAVTRMDSSGVKPVVWLLDLLRGTSTRFSFGSLAAYSGAWSPDGNRIFFGKEDDGGGMGLYQKLASGVKDEELLVKSPDSKHPTSISRDGRFLLYTTTDAKTKKTAVWVLPLEGDRKPLPLLNTGFNSADGQFSPDGHWVSYESDESGRNEIYVQTFSHDPTAASTIGGKWLISTSGGSQSRWRGDSSELYYLAPDAKLMAVEVATNPVFRAGVPHALFQIPPPPVMLSPVLRAWDVTSDGKRFLFSVSGGQSTSPFAVVLNWQSALKK